MDVLGVINEGRVWNDPGLQLLRDSSWLGFLKLPRLALFGNTLSLYQGP